MTPLGVGLIVCGGVSVLMAGAIVVLVVLLFRRREPGPRRDHPVTTMPPSKEKPAAPEFGIKPAPDE